MSTFGWSPFDFGIKDYNSCLVYFDHKVGNEFSSFPDMLLKGYFKGTHYGKLINGHIDEKAKNDYITYKERN